MIEHHACTCGGAVFVTRAVPARAASVEEQRDRGRLGAIGGRGSCSVGCSPSKTSFEP